MIKVGSIISSRASLAAPSDSLTTYLRSSPEARHRGRHALPGRPQGIEWAYADDHVWLLQAWLGSSLLDYVPVPPYPIDMSTWVPYGPIPCRSTPVSAPDVQSVRLLHSTHTSRTAWLPAEPAADVDRGSRSVDVDSSKLTCSQPGGQDRSRQTCPLPPRLRRARYLDQMPRCCPITVQVSHSTPGRCLHVEANTHTLEETWPMTLGFPRRRSPASTADC